MAGKGQLFIISGPSGVGKGTLCKKLAAKRSNVKMSVSVTTRSPRPGEKEGEHYFYRSSEEFRRMIENNEFLEYMCVFGNNNYGTPRSYVEQQRAEGRDVMLEIDVNGALKVKEKCPEAVLIFIAPPDLATLRRRLEGRCTESKGDVERRLGEAGKELALAEKYDYIVINDRLEDAVDAVDGIMTAEHLRTANNLQLINQFKGGQ